MDMQSSVLTPLGQAAKNISTAAGNLAEMRPRLADVDTDAMRARLSNTSRQLAHSARVVAGAASVAAAPYLQKLASTSHQQLKHLGETLESGAREVAKRWSGKRGNVLTRHPVAATLLLGSLGYLAYRAWQRARTPVRAAARKAARRRTTRRSNSHSAGRAKATHAPRSSAIN